MRLPRLLLVLLAFGLAGLFPLHAQQAAGSTYSVVVPVSDTTEAQRDQAFSTALGQVLARVAGGEDLRSLSGYADALKGAVGMVQKYQYQRAGSGLELTVNFDPGSVNRLISKLGAPTAGVKPPVLLLVQGADGKPLTGDALQPLVQSAAAQGYDVVSPDSSDLPNRSKLAAADPAALAAVAAKYRTGLVLLGNLHAKTADWTLVSGGAAQEWTNSGATEDAMMSDAASSMAARIGKKLNVIGSGSSSGSFWVTGLNSAMDYASLLNLLRSDPMVQDVQTTGADNEGVSFMVKANLPLPALAAHLAAGGRVLQGSPHQGADVSLRWLP